MSLAYDEVIEVALEQCEGSAEFAANAETALLVRSLTGQVRLVLRLKPDAPRDLLTQIDKRLGEKLGKWFHAPTICPTQGADGLRRLAAHLLTESDRRVEDHGWDANWPSGWPQTISLRIRPGSIPMDPRWRAQQVTLGKEPWLALGDGKANPPWPLQDGCPRITAFYGFKGGVGRSTSVAILAWQLARMGRSVVCVDLDLEAPGLTQLLRPEPLPSDRGYVIDELLTAAATGSGLAQLPLVPVEVHGATFDLAPAGVLGPTYVEKLARLDMLHRNPGKSPVHLALEGLLKRIRSRSEGPPHHILLDCRSGLHDLAGLALHDLSHVDVLVGRGDRQELEGLKVLLPGLVRRRRIKDLRLLVLRTFLPTRDLEARLETHRSDLYDLFVEHIYLDEPPSPTDRGIAHDPCPVPYQEEVAYADGLRNISPDTLSNSHYKSILVRLEDLWSSEETSA